jgi:serine/alanine adding enzyme
MMEEMYRDYGTPIFPYSYLSNMWDELVPKGHFFFLIVKHKDNLIGGGCFHHYHDTITFKYGCCLKAFSPMRPYNALTWKGITHGIDNGARHFNFGATSIKDEGLLFFKKGWGAEKGKAFFYYLPIKGQPPKMEAYLDSFQWIKKIWRRLPKPMLRLVGPYFYKWIC